MPRILCILCLVALCGGCATRSVSVPSGITKVVVVDHIGWTNRTFTASSEIQPILDFISARTNGWRRVSGVPEVSSIINAHLYRDGNLMVSFGADVPRFRYGWWLTRRAREAEVREFFSLVGEDYRAHVPER